MRSPTTQESIFEMGQPVFSLGGRNTRGDHESRMVPLRPSRSSMTCGGHVDAGAKAIGVGAGGWAYDA